MSNEPNNALKAAPDFSLGKIEEVEGALLQLPQVDIPLEHRFAPGVYLREVFMPKDTFVIGHCHKTEHFNIVTQGKATVMIEGKMHHIVAPAVFKSNPNVRKVLYIEEDMRWLTVHPTEETDLGKLEEVLIEKSAAFVAHQKELEQLQAHVAAQRKELCPGSP